MKINVLLSPHNVDELYFSQKTSIVIDVLRATTVIVTALENGAREVIPVSSVDFAMKVSGNAFGGQTLLGGERNTTKIEGFNLGNSPSEYTNESVVGKSIILYTTNGSKAIVKAKFSENLFVCSFKNLKAIAAHIAKLNKDTEILCAGSNGMFCIEDTVCAGRLINEINTIANDIELTDAAKASVVLNNSSGDNILEMLKNSEHGLKLINNGFESDLKDCSALGVSDVIPVFNSGVIKSYKEETNIKVE